MRDMFEVLGRLDKLPPSAFEQYLAQNKPPPPAPEPVAPERRKHKPDGLPSIAPPPVTLVPNVVQAASPQFPAAPSVM